jgi:hypothetical protein
MTNPIFKKDGNTTTSGNNNGHGVEGHQRPY